MDNQEEKKHREPDIVIELYVSDAGYQADFRVRDSLGEFSSSRDWVGSAPTLEIWIGCIAEAMSRARSWLIERRMPSQEFDLFLALLRGSEMNAANLGLILKHGDLIRIRNQLVTATVSALLMENLEIEELFEFTFRKR